MPTARGWTVATTGLVLEGVGLAFGSTAIQQLGFAFVVLLVVAVVVVRMGRHDLEIDRTVSPPRARPGQPVELTIRIWNRGHGSAPLLLLEDNLPAGLTGSARFALQGIEPGGKRSTSLALKAARRGRYKIGPLAIAVVDPFSMARVTSTASPVTSFLVHPKMELLTMQRETGERRSHSSSALRQPTGARGEDFYTLREYVEGDDLRKIHWPSTAKRGRFMIRQEETPWHTRATIILDDRSQAHDGLGSSSSFERSVEAAASIVDLYHRSAYAYRISGAHHAGIPTGRGSEHWNRCLDLLAEIGAQRNDVEDALSLRLQELEAGSAAEASAILIAGRLSAAHAVALTRMKQRYRQVTVVSFPPHRFGSATTKSRWDGERAALEIVRLLGRSGIRAIVLGPDEPLAGAWNSLSGRRAAEREGAWGPRPELV